MSNNQLCRTCLHRKSDFSESIYCGLTGDKYELPIRCDKYQSDEMEKIRDELKTADMSIAASGGKRFANYLIDFIAYLLLCILFGSFMGVLSSLTGMDISWVANMGTITEYFMGFVLMSSYYILDARYCRCNDAKWEV